MPIPIKELLANNALFISAIELYYESPDFYDEHDLTPHDITFILESFCKQEEIEVRIS